MRRTTPMNEAVREKVALVWRQIDVRVAHRQRACSCSQAKGDGDN